MYSVAMAFRDDLGAAHARAEALERTVAELESENRALRAAQEGAEAEAPASLALALDVPHDSLPAKQRKLGRWHTPSIVAAVSVYASLVLMPGPVQLFGGIFTTLIILFVVAALNHVEIVGPEEILVLSGRQNLQPDGSTSGFRVVTAGRTMRYPLVEMTSRLSTRPIPYPFQIKGAYTSGGVPANLDGCAVVRVNPQAPHVFNAVERFLGRSLTEIARVARETMEGHARGIISELTLQEIAEGREAFAQLLVQESESDFEKLGLELVRVELLTAIAQND